MDTDGFTTCLWFDGRAEEAARFYVSLFENSSLGAVTRYPEGAHQPAGTVLTVDFTANGQRFVALNGGPEFRFNEAISFQITCDDQKEVDHYWAELTEGGGEEGPAAGSRTGSASPGRSSRAGSRRCSATPIPRRWRGPTRP